MEANSPSGSLDPCGTGKAPDLPQNHLVYKVLQGLTLDEFPVQNEMLGNCRREHLIVSRGATNANVERHDTGQWAAP